MSKLKSVSVLRQEDKEFFKNFPLIFWLIFVVFGVLLLIPIMIYIGFSAKAYTGTGSGTGSDPYQISTCEQLQSINNEPSANYILVNDVDCSDTVTWANGLGFDPISSFSGTLDGRNHKIIGLYINRPDSLNVALFVTLLPNSVVKNIFFTNSQATEGTAAITGGQFVATLVSEITLFGGTGTVTIANVHSELNIKASLNNITLIGGLVGQAYIGEGTDLSVYIDQSSYAGNMSVSDTAESNVAVYMGGLIGLARNDNAIQAVAIRNSYSVGSLTTSNNDSVANYTLYCGGLAGVFRNNAFIETSYASGSVDCPGNDANTSASGGLVGLILYSTAQERIKSSFAVGQITKTNNNAGGLVGTFNSPSGGLDLSNLNFFDATKTGQADCVGNDPTIQCEKVNISNSEPDRFDYWYVTPRNVWAQDGQVWESAAYSDQNPGLPKLAVPSVMPDAPTNFQVERTEQSFELSWDAPTDIDGRGKNITDYQIEYQIAAGTQAWSTWITIDDGASDATIASITNLDLSKSYKFRLAAINDKGKGLYSSEVTNNLPVPQKVTGVNGTAKAKSFEITWNQLETASSYKAQYRKAGDSGWISTGLDLDVQNRKFYEAGLTPQTTYEIRIAGLNDGGQGEWSDTYQITTTAQNSYSITNCQQLQDMKNDLSGSYTLANNIDCSETENWNNGQGFEPVGNLKQTPFSGDFDGNNKTISGLYVSTNVEYNTQEYYGSGLFGFAYAATVKNVRFNNASMNATYYLSSQDDQNGDGVPDSLSGAIDNVASDIPQNIPQNLNDLQGSAVSLGQNAPLAGIALSDGLPEVYAGVVAGLVYGGGSFTNINVTNSAVLGASSGLAIGGVYTFKGLFSINDIADPNLSPFSPLNQSPQTVISNINTSGAVNGVVGGGVIGTIATEGSTTNAVRILISNSNSTASVDANIGGGIVGASGSLSVLLPIIFAVNNNTEDLGSSINSAVNALPVRITNSISRGTISTCNSASGVQIGALGGIVGAALNTRIENSSSSSKVEACSNIFGQLFNFGDGEIGAVYGGSLGGVAGVMILSQIDNSFATGQVSTKLNPTITYGQVGDQQVTPGVNASITGGLVGTIVSAVDQNDAPVINKSYSTGKVKNVGGSGMVGISGGLIGTMIGSGTIKSSYATGAVEVSYSQYTFGGAVVTGGLIGSGLGVDAISVAETFLSGTPKPSQGIIINQSYATGNVVIDKKASQTPGLSLSISGGLGGILLGNATVLNSKATGNIDNDYTLQLKANNTTPLTNVNLSGSVSGGLVGTTLGINAQPLLGLLTSQEVQPADGILISNSYATGNANGMISGGLVGYADFKVRLNKAYADGDVTGVTAGGLVGGTGLLGAATQSALGIIFAAAGTNQESPPPAIVGSIFNKISDIYAPVVIQNTYATGNVTASPINFNFVNNETDQPYLNQVNLPALAGGLIGFYAAGGSLVENSYASGAVTISESSQNAGQNDPNKVTAPNLPAAAGGLFGFTLAFPQADIDKIYNNTNLPFLDYLKDPVEVKDSFSASKISAPANTFTGSVSGFLVSPFSTVAQIIQQNIVNTDKDKLYKIENLYYDQFRQDTTTCVGPTNPKSFVKDTINSVNIPDGILPVDTQTGQTTQNVYNNLKDYVNNNQQFNELYDTYVAPGFDPLSCNAVNKNNSQPAYFKNNKTNAPLNKWNFNSVWVTRKNDYPKFTAGPEDPTPVPVPVPPKVTPIKPVAQNNPRGGTQVGGAGAPVPTLAQLLNPENVKAKKDNWLVSLLKKIPEPVAKTIPFALLLVLIAITLFYTYSALLEKHRRAQLQLIIRRIYASGKARATYMSIISHYLNTPLTKMRSTIELLHGIKKLPDDINKAVTKELSNVAKSTDTLLTMGQNLTMSQQQEIKTLESIKLPSILTKPAVWLPISILFTLTLLANILFVYADRYDINGMMILTQIVLGLIGGATIVVSYFQLTNAKNLRLAVNRQAEVEKSTAQQQGQFIDSVYSAFSDEVDHLSTFTKDISSLPKSEGFKAGLDELKTVVDKMDKIATLSRNVPGVVWKTNATQTLKNVMSEVRVVADKVGVSIQTNIKSNAFVNVDEKSLAHLFSAPLINAVEYSKSGSKVAITVEQIDKAVVLTIADKGRGIAEKQLIQLFEPFSRFESTEQFDHQGMGLDLYLCQVITEHYGGSIVLVSREGEGTTARIKVPLSPSV